MMSDLILAKVNKIYGNSVFEVKLYHSNGPNVLAKPIQKVCDMRKSHGEKFNKLSSGSSNNEGSLVWVQETDFKLQRTGSKYLIVSKIDEKNRSEYIRLKERYSNYILDPDIDNENEIDDEINIDDI